MSSSDQLLLYLLEYAPEPQLSISNTPRVEEETRVVCSVQHTCFSSPPLLTISGILGSDQTSDTSVSDGVWERRVERRWTPKEEDQIVKCTVHYQGGQTATSELRLNVECKSSQNRFNWIAKQKDIYACFFVCVIFIFRLRSI